MWIKYFGEKIYSNIEIRDLNPGERRDIDEGIANRLIKKYPNWFKPCSINNLQIKIAEKVTNLVPKPRIKKSLLEKVKK